MPPLSDPERLAAYKDALANWSITNYVQFELTEQAYRWIRRELAGITLKELARLMHEHVAAGGVISEVRETRAGWLELYEFHYDLHLTVYSIPVYVETRLHFCMPIVPDESWILVVNIHEP